MRQRCRPGQSADCFALQYTQIAITGEYTELPGDLKHTVSFTATKPDGSLLFTTTQDVSQVTSRKVSLFYEPETVEDQELINSYGGLSNTPSYLVHLRPLLKIDGERIIVAQDGLLMGAD